MKILHYSLGFPPYRSGGLTKYCMDLAKIQVEQGHEVGIMWPGKIKVSGHLSCLKVGKNIDKIHNIEVINPLPVSLDEGITDIEAYTKKCENPEVFENFFTDNKIEVLHIHTLMGLYKEVLEVAKKLGIRIVFTSHDYFGICPKVTLFRNGKVCDGDCNKCGSCNEGALSLKKIMIMQSPTYRALKESGPVKALRSRHRQEFFEEVSGELKIDEKPDMKDTYERLRHYYIDILSMVDMIHFNSSVTESVYRKYLPKTVKGKVVNITHKNIKNDKKLKKFTDKLKIVYLAPAKPFKGYGIMKDALDELWNEGNRDFQIDMYNEAVEDREFIHVHEKFQYEDLVKIFNQSDVLIMPSVWYETYGFTVLEALSYGVPVIVTENVGAKDLLENGKYGIITEPTKDGIKEAVKKILDDKKILEDFNKKIYEELDLDRVINSIYEIEKMYEE